MSRAGCSDDFRLNLTDCTASWMYRVFRRKAPRFFSLVSFIRTNNLLNYLRYDLFLCKKCLFFYRQLYTLTKYSYVYYKSTKSDHWIFTNSNVNSLINRANVASKLEKEVILGDITWQREKKVPCFSIIFSDINDNL